MGLALLGMAMGFPEAARAQASSVSGEVALSSQLVDRGAAITPTTPILQGAATWTSASGWALGVSGSTQTRRPDRLVEALLEASRYWSIATDWQMQASLIYYSYPGGKGAEIFDRTELGVAWVYRDVLTFGLSAARMIHGYNHQPRGAADLDLHWPLPWRLSVSAGVGVAQALTAYRGPQWYGLGGYYRYGHAGLAWNDGGLRLELNRILTDGLRKPPGVPGATWVGTVSWAF